MAKPSSELQEKLKSLRPFYLEELRNKIDQIEKGWKGLTESSWDLEVLKNIYQLAHKLSGSGGIYGFDAVSHTAKALEDMLEPLTKKTQLPSLEEKKQIELSIQKLKRVSLDAEQEVLKENKRKK